jgi:hypothetical protein
LLEAARSVKPKAIKQTSTGRECRREKARHVDLLDVDGSVSNVHEEEIMEAIYQAISQPRTKRRHSSAEERRIVENKLVPSASVVIEAHAHGEKVNRVFARRKPYRAESWGVRQRSQYEFRVACCGSPSLPRLSAGIGRET